MPSLLLSHSARRRQRVAAALGNGFLLAVTSLSTLAVLFIFYFIARDALPFFRLEGFREFFTSARWYPSSEHAEFGALAIFVGSGLVTMGAVAVAVPLGVAAAICLSDVLPFTVRQVVKPVIEILAAIPSVAAGLEVVGEHVEGPGRVGGHAPKPAIADVAVEEIQRNRPSGVRGRQSRWLPISQR